MNTEVIQTITTILVLIVFFFIEWTLGLYLWNIIAVAIFGLPSLTCWQFLGLWALTTILFGNRTAIQAKEAEE